MASTTFNIDENTGGGANVQLSSAVTVASGEAVRVRFSERSGPASVHLEITANSVVSLVKITDVDGWVSIGVGAGDVCKVRVDTHGDPRSKVVGVLETIA